MGGHLLWYGRVLLEIRGEVNGALARVLEVSTDLRLLFLVEVEARLGVVFDAAGEDPPVDVLIAAHRLEAALEREPAVHRVVVELLHRLAADGAASAAAGRVAGSSRGLRLPYLQPDAPG